MQRVSKKWQISKQKSKDLLTQLLLNRGIEDEKEQEEFLNPSKPSFKNIFPKTKIDKKSFELAIERIIKAIQDEEKIIVYGDYDADGITGTTIMWETIYYLGGKAMPYIPDREKEGYGLNKGAISGFAESGVKLLITVDCGITNVEEVSLAKSLGIDIIVTDHHQKGERVPEALAIIHDDSLVGVSVVWVLAEGLKKKVIEEKKFNFKEIKLNQNWDLVAIGTIADLQPLMEKNRSFVKWGLEELGKTKRLGLRKIIEQVGLTDKKITVYEVGFVIAPRLNASGRLHQALEALRLLCTREELQALSLVESISKLNLQRQEMTLVSFEEAVERIEIKMDKKILILSDEGWHEGIVGLIASRMKEKYYRPSIAISVQNGIGKGSARSIKGFNMIEALRKLEDDLLNLGGHPMAAGFSIEEAKIQIFKERLEELGEEKITEEILEDKIMIEKEIQFEEINWENNKEIDKLKPFGIANHEPFFLLEQAEVKNVFLMGRDKKHLKVILGKEGSQANFEAVGFGMGQFFSDFKMGEKVDIVFSFLENEWRGVRKLNLKMKDFRFSD